MRIAVLGAGAWGTALAALISEPDGAGGGGHEVALWEVDRAVARRLAATRANDYLGIRLGERIAVTSDLGEAVRDRDLVLLAVPSEVLRDVMTAAAPHLGPGITVVCATKGLEAGTHLTMDRVIGDVAPGVPVVLLSGPTFAKEIAAGLPAAVVAASRDAAARELVQHTLGVGRFRVYTSDDVVGVALGGALKNVVAIGIGVSDGLGFGANARAALITRGLHEMSRLAVRAGAHPLTLSGLAGMGDLVLTCTGDLSRNRQVGLALARGEALPSVLARLGQVAEGVGTATAAVELAAALDVDVPIMANVAAVIAGHRTPREAGAELLARESRPERD